MNETLKSDQQKKRQTFAAILIAVGLVSGASLSSLIPNLMSKFGDERTLASFDETATGGEVAVWAADQEKNNKRALAGTAVSEIEKALIETFPKGTQAKFSENGTISSLELPTLDSKRAFKIESPKEFILNHRALFTKRPILEVLQDGDLYILKGNDGSDVRLAIHFAKDRTVKKIEVLDQ